MVLQPIPVGAESTPLAPEPERLSAQNRLQILSERAHNGRTNLGNWLAIPGGALALAGLTESIGGSGFGYLGTLLGSAIAAPGIYFLVSESTPETRYREIIELPLPNREEYAERQLSSLADQAKLNRYVGAAAWVTAGMAYSNSRGANGAAFCFASALFLVFVSSVEEQQWHYHRETF